jgi:hypothetical protein
MSFLLNLSEDRLDVIVPLLAKFEEKVRAAEPIFQLEGRRLEEILRSVPHHQASYDQTYQDCKGLEDWLQNIKDKKVGKLWRKYNEGYSRQLTTRDIQAYIAADQEIVELNQILIEIVVIKNNLNAIVEAIKQIGWMVGHVTKLRVAEIQDATL